MGLIAWMKDVYRRASASDGERFRPRVAERPATQDEFAGMVESIRRSYCGCYRHGARNAYERYASSDERKFRVYRAISDKLFSHCDTTRSSTSDSNTPIVLDALRATMREARRGNVEAITGLARIVSDLSSCEVYWKVETSPEGANYGPRHGLQLSEAKEMFDAIGTLARSGNYEAAFHLRSPARSLLWYFDSAYDSNIRDNEQYLERRVASWERGRTEFLANGVHIPTWEESKKEIYKFDDSLGRAEWVLNRLRPYADQVNGMLWAIENGPTYRVEAFQQVIHADLPLWEKAERLRPLTESAAAKERIASLVAPPAPSAQDVLIAEFKRSYDHKRTALGRLDQERLVLEKRLSEVQRRWDRVRSDLDSRIGALQSLRGELTADLESERTATDTKYLDERDGILDALRAVSTRSAMISLDGDVRNTSKQEAETNRKIMNRTLPKAEYQRLRELSRAALFAQRQPAPDDGHEAEERGVAGSRRER